MKATKTRGQPSRKAKAAPAAAAPLRTPLPPDVEAMREEELARGIELHTALTAMARRIAFREIEALERLHALSAYFRAFRLLCDSTAKEISDARKIPGETQAFADRWYLPEKEAPCAK